MNRTLVRKLLYPIHERLRGRSTYKFLRAFRSHDAWSADQLASNCDQRVAALVAHAQAQVPFWREHTPNIAVATADDLTALPTMDKAFIRDHLEELVHVLDLYQSPHCSV